MLSGSGTEIAMNVGVLALQGDFREHREVLERIGVPVIEVRQPKHLAHIERLIIPGGESTTIGRLMVLYDLLAPIRERAQQGMPVWGTCAGAILLSQRVADGKPDQPSLALMDITARRNAFGRQLDSFEVDLHIEAIGEEPLHTVFIRAPTLEAPGPTTTTLAALDNGRIVAAQQGRLLATSFHPELTHDDRLHRYFLEL